MKPMPRSFCFLLCLLPLAANSAEDVFLDEDFESYALGERPVATALVDDGGLHQVRIVGGVDNTAGGGTGQGLRLVDLGDGVAGIEYNVASAAETTFSHLRVAFDMAWSGGAFETDSIVFSVGPYVDTTATTMIMSSNSARMLAGVFRELGEFKFSGSEGSSSWTPFAGENLPLTIELVVNDHNTDTLAYFGPDGAVYRLAANSFALYVDATFIHSETLGVKDNSTDDGDAGIGRIGFYSGTGGMGLDYIIDNLVATSVEGAPEPVSIFAATPALEGFRELPLPATMLGKGKNKNSFLASILLTSTRSPAVFDSSSCKISGRITSWFKDYIDSA